MSVDRIVKSALYVGAAYAIAEAAGAPVSATTSNNSLNRNLTNAEGEARIIDIPNPTLFILDDEQLQASPDVSENGSTDVLNGPSVEPTPIPDNFSFSPIAVVDASLVTDSETGRNITVPTTPSFQIPESTHLLLTQLHGGNSPIALADYIAALQPISANEQALNDFAGQAHSMEIYLNAAFGDGDYLDGEVALTQDPEGRSYAAVYFKTNQEIGNPDGTILPAGSAIVAVPTEEGGLSDVIFSKPEGDEHYIRPMFVDTPDGKVATLGTTMIFEGREIVTSIKYYENSELNTMLTSQATVIAEQLNIRDRNQNPIGRAARGASFPVYPQGSYDFSQAGARMISIIGPDGNIAYVGQGASFTTITGPEYPASSSSAEGTSGAITETEAPPSAEMALVLETAQFGEAQIESGAGLGFVKFSAGYINEVMNGTNFTMDPEIATQAMRYIIMESRNITNQALAVRGEPAVTLSDEVTFSVFKQRHMDTTPDKKMTGAFDNINIYVVTDAEYEVVRYGFERNASTLDSFVYISGTYGDRTYESGILYIDERTNTLVYIKKVGRYSESAQRRKGTAYSIVRDGLTTAFGSITESMSLGTALIVPTTIPNYRFTADPLWYLVGCNESNDGCVTNSPYVTPTPQN